MKYYVQFLEKNASYTQEAGWKEEAGFRIPCGSGGVYILDGRNSMETMHKDAKKKAQRMEHFKQFAGYCIVRADNGRFRDIDPNKYSNSYTVPVKLNYPIHV